MLLQIAMNIIGIAAAFFTALEHQDDGPLQAVPPSRQHFGSRQQHSRVHIVSAAVRHAGDLADTDLGPLSVVGRFGYLQGIAVGTEHDRFSGQSAMDKAQNAAIGNIHGRNAAFFQF